MVNWPRAFLLIQTDRHVSRWLRHQWVRSIGQLRGRSGQRPASGSFPLHRRLRFEPLEDRRLLTITVNTLIDEADGSIVDGDVSLRDAIALAANGEIINFASFLTEGGPAAIVLTLDQLAITKSLTINGPGANLLTIDASGSDPTPDINNGDGSQVFEVLDAQIASLSTVTINGVTITGGDVTTAPYGGGGIRSFENLTINDCIIRDNSTDDDGFVTWLGGGVLNLGGNLTINRSTIRDNHAGQGGGVFSWGNLQIYDCTFSGNSADLGAGGIYFESDFVGPATALISNSTITGNSATWGGGLYNRRGPVMIRHCTITNNSAVDFGGGVATFDAPNTQTSVFSSIIAGNAGDDIEAFGAVNTFQSLGYNVIGTGVGTDSFNQSGDMTGVVVPGLAPLADNGGPTRTHALLPTSVAFNSGNPAAVAGAGGVPLTDQRGIGFSRIKYGRIDIGSYEADFAVPASLVVSTLIDEMDDDLGPADLSLREAIWLANLEPDVQTITFDPTLTSGGPATSDLGAFGQLAIKTSVTISGPGADRLTIRAFSTGGGPGSGTRVFNIHDGNATVDKNVAISGFTLTGGNTSGGGAIFNFENLTLTSCAISGNTALFGGGAVYSGAGTSLTINSTTFTGNHAGLGGGISAAGTILNINKSRFSGNTTTTYGGGIYALSSTVSITDTGISDNSANYGGGFFGRFGGVTITGSTISGNQSGVSGGGIFSASATLTVINSTISGNSANSYGGGLYSVHTNVNIRHSTITGNRADADNSAIGRGGGTYATGSGSKALDHVIVAGNLRGTATRNDVAGAAIGIRFSLIGDNTGSILVDNGGNLIGTFASPINPSLGPLTDNGGPTLTHALVAGSPAIGAGDSTAVGGVGGVPLYDQRGAPFARVAAGRIDIGATDRQAIPPAVFGDYNQNGVVDAADYVMWRKLFGTSVASPFTGADGDGDGTIDQDDYGVWRAHFGQTLPPSGAGSGTGQASSIVSQELQAEAESNRSIPADQIGESVVIIPLTTMSASANTDAAAAQEASFAALETRSRWRNLSTWSRGRIDQYQVAETDGDDLRLLLAVDRVWRTLRQDSFVSDDSENGEHRADADDSDAKSMSRSLHGEERGARTF